MFFKETNVDWDSSQMFQSLSNEIVPNITLLEKSPKKVSSYSPEFKMLRNETQYEPRFPRRQVREENSTLWYYSGCVNQILLSRDDSSFWWFYSRIVWMVNTTVTDVTLVTSGRYFSICIDYNSVTTVCLSSQSQHPAGMGRSVNINSLLVQLLLWFTSKKKNCHHSNHLSRKNLCCARIELPFLPTFLQ